MGKITITVNLDEEVVRKLREMRAREKIGKGFFGRIINEAVREWTKKKEKDNVSKALELLERGIDMGGIISKKREDWHKR
jgi:hypothetical protein